MYVLVGVLRGLALLGIGHGRAVSSTDPRDLANFPRQCNGILRGVLLLDLRFKGNQSRTVFGVNLFVQFMNLQS